MANSTICIGNAPGVCVHMKAKGSSEGASRSMYFRLLVRFLHPCQSLYCRPYRVLIKIHNSSGCMNGHPLIFYDGFIVVCKGGIVEGVFPVALAKEVFVIDTLNGKFVDG